MKEIKRPIQSEKMTAYWANPENKARRLKAWHALPRREKDKRVAKLNSKDGRDKRKETLRNMSPSDKKKWLAGINSPEAQAKARETRRKNGKEIGARLNSPEVVAKRSIGIKASANTAPATAASWSPEARAKRIRNRQAKVAAA